uniref:ABC transporter domain-containing protein n=1 Tax=Ditylenchus dipsaci TaxID=166011 RepID=A0A915CQD8_9BILA
MRSIRDFLGFCPQHNILFDRMTVEEQLYFYASLKGVEGDKLANEVEVTLLDIGLQVKRTALANTLSGGMKRKLCIGIALIGGSKLIILDEPTAGIDAFARRSIWQLLLKHKQGRTMILSTHHMDEADVLADRIAIISEGKLKSSGSSLFLKKSRHSTASFASGGNLFSPIIEEDEQSVQLPLTYCPANQCLLGGLAEVNNSAQTRLTKFIENFCGKDKAQLVEDVEFEYIYKLPLDMCSDKLASLFEGLEAEKESLGIESYGLSAPSLQQIFLTVAPVHDLQLKKELSSTSLSYLTKQLVRKCQPKSPSVAASNVRKSQLELKTELVIEGEQAEGDKDYEHPVTKFIHNWSSLQIHHFKALLRKRVNVSKRSGFSLFAELVLPLCLLLSAEVYIHMQTPQGTTMMAQNALALTPISFGNGTNQYFGLWTIIKQLVLQPGNICKHW